MKVMLVDDDLHMLSFLQNIVPWKSLGYEVAGTAASGDEALAAVGTIEPDLIISDLRMPMMDGITFSKLFHQQRDDVPIIFLTAYGDLETMQQAMKTRNVIDFILKPLSPDKIDYLCSVLRELCAGYTQKAFLTDILHDQAFRQQIISRLRAADSEWFGTFFDKLRSCDSCRYQLVYSACERLLHLLYLSGLQEAPSSEEASALAELQKKYAKNELVRDVSERYMNVLFYIGRTNARNADVVNKTKEYIDLHYASPLFDLSAMAEQLHYSPVYLNRIFTQSYGETVKNYIDRLRFEHALSKLKDGAISINDVAQLSGYSNQNYFARIFKAKMHITPSEYRTRLLLNRSLEQEKAEK